MATTKIASGAGLRHIRYYLLDTDGYPDDDQSGANGYDGRRVTGAKSFTGNVPDATVIVHTGDDRPFAMDVLPPTALETAMLTTGKTNLEVDAELTDTLVVNKGELQIGGMSTSKQGSEKQVCVMGWRQALDTDPSSANFGQRRYITNMYPSARIIPKAGPMNQGAPDENSYNVVPSVVTQTPWGETFSEATWGFTEAQRMRIVSDYPLMMERWTGDGANKTFNLQATPISTDRTLVWADGSEATVSSVDTTVDTLTLNAAPDDGAVVVALYETSDSLS